MNISINKVNSDQDFKECINIRLIVFVEGQNVPMSEEIDGKDENSEHYLLAIDNSPVGTARIRYMDNIAKIERVAILDEYQGLGLGNKLMKHIIHDLHSYENIDIAKLSSQSYAIKFYEKLGFIVCSEEYMDAGIPHKDMELKL